MRIERGLVLVLLIDQVVPRIFDPALNDVHDAAGFPAGLLLKFPERFYDFIFVSGFNC